MHFEKEFGILVDSSLSLTAQIDAVVIRFRGMLAFIMLTFKRLAPQLFILHYSAVVHPYFEYNARA